MAIFVFRPGGVQTDNVFNDWATLVDALKLIQGRRIVEFDDSLVAPAGGCVIPPGVWEMADVSWTGFGPRGNRPRSRVLIQEGAVFTNFRMIGGQVTIVNQATTTSPISDFAAGSQVQIGLRDDAGNAELINEGAAPLFNITAGPVFFFVQNCLLGPKSLHPLIRFTGTAGPLFLNLLGLNQTGNNLVRTGPGAKVVFAALSPAAQVGIDQSTIVDPDGIRFGPVGRIQRQVLPLPPAPPAVAQLVPSVTQQFFTLPNVLLRCDGRAAGFVQPLPKIRGGFTMGADGSVAAYSGGQEVVIAEVSGGARLLVRPAPGDTIDGFSGDVAIGAFESRTFASDGASNWITTATGRASFGAERVTAIRAVFETADVPDTGPKGDVFLGLGGREFRCDTAGNNFQQGGIDTFVFGLSANVLNPNPNDPAAPQLVLSSVSRFPVYVRFEQGNKKPWRFTRLMVTLTTDPGPHPPPYTSTVHHPGGLSLGADSGSMVFLVQSADA